MEAGCNAAQAAQVMFLRGIPLGYPWMVDRVDGLWLMSIVDGLIISDYDLCNVSFNFSTKLLDLPGKHGQETLKSWYSTGHRLPPSKFFSRGDITMHI